MLIDVHCHLHEYSDEEVSEILSLFKGVIVSVGDDEESSRRNLDLASRYPGRVIPCLGLHPWEVKGRDSVEEARRIAELIVEQGVPCIGEVGLDKKFCPQTIDVQREVFNVFLEAAAETGAMLNIHSPKAWREVLDAALRAGVKRLNFHWYTGPVELLEEIEAQGYTVSVNPALRIQAKHRLVVEHAPLEMILTESDAPYKYRGMRLTPLMIPMVIREIAAIKGVSPDVVERVVARNASRLLSLPHLA